MQHNPTVKKYMDNSIGAQYLYLLYYQKSQIPRAVRWDIGPDAKIYIILNHKVLDC